MGFFKSQILKQSLLVLLLLITIDSCSGNNFFIVVPDNYFELAEQYSVLKNHSFTVVTFSEYSKQVNEQNHPFNADTGVFMELIEAKPFEQVPEHFICIGRTILVPAVPLKSLVDTVNLEDIKSYFLQNGELPDSSIVVPLEKLSLPFKAISVQGKYINEPDYPLVQKLYARLVLTHGDSEIDSGNDKNLLGVLASFWNKLQRWLYKQLVWAWLHSVQQKEITLQQDECDLQWVVAVGDVMLGRGIDQRLKQEGVDAVFTDTLPHLRQGSITACNFEASLSQGKGPVKKSYNFFVPSWTLEYLQQAGFNYITLTNNHVWDFGLEGFIETLKLVRESSLVTSGVGMNLAEAEKPWIITKGKTKFAVLSVAAYPKEKNGFNGKEVASAGAGKPGILFSGRGAEQAMKKYFTTDTFNIVFVHGGIEGSEVPGEEFEKLYRSYVDLGADLVIGSHPHILQRMEVYNDALIAYSLGDFIFAEMDDVPGGEDGLILKVGIAHGHIVYVEAIPVKLSYVDVRLKHDIGELEKFMSLK